MSLIWILVILIGTAITIIGGLKLNDEWTKTDTIRQQHTIPDFLLIDFEIKAKIDSVLTEQILKEVKPKIYIHGDSIENQ